MGNGGFDNNGFDQGGGFTQDAGFDGGSQQSPSKKSNYEKQCLMSATIKQLIDCDTKPEDESFLLDGQEVSLVKIVGTIIEEERQSTNVTLQVEDASGRMEVKMWIAEDGDLGDDTRAEWAQGVTVEVVGQLRSYNGAKNITAYSIKKIEDFNAVSHHMLEAIYVHLRNTNKITQGNSAVKTESTMQSMNAMQTNSFNSNNFGAQQITSAGGDHMGSGNVTNDQILAVFSADSGEAGVALSQVQSILSSKNINIGAGQIKQIVDGLCEEGLLYSTIDDEHFKSTM